MKKKLEIIISHYQEPYSVVKPGIDMLKSQRCVNFNDFRVTMIHDGPFNEYGAGFYPPYEIANAFPFEFNEIVIPHCGISGVRNYGIDHADAEWILFCDCDDSFTSVFSLSRLMSGLTGPFNMLWAPYYVEKLNDDGTSTLAIEEKFNLVWIHSKFYRLDFLKGHHIRFNENLEFLEDGAFNMLFYLETPENTIGRLNTETPYYSWRRRKNSLTTNHKNLMKLTAHTLERDKYVSGLFKERNRPTAGLMVGRTITDAWIVLTQKRVEPYPDKIKVIEKGVRDFWDENESYIQNLTKPQWDYVMKASENESIQSNVFNPDKPDFDTWLKERLGVERTNK